MDTVRARLGGGVMTTSVLAAVLTSAFVVLASLATPAHASVPAVYLVPSTIPNECTSTSPDVTSRLQAWLNQVPDGSTAELSPHACYRVEGTLTLARRHDLTVEGNGATLRSFTDGQGFVRDLAQRYHVFVWGGSDVTFRDLSVVGDDQSHRYTGPAYEDQAGFWIWGVQGAVLDDVTVADVRGDFIYLGPDTYQSWRWSDDVTVENSRFIDSGRQGLAITGAENVRFVNNTMSNAALSAFDIEPNSATGHPVGGVPTYGGAADIVIAHNVVGAARTLFLSASGAPSVVTGVSVVDNVLAGQPLTVLVNRFATTPGTSWEIEGNRSTGVYSSPNAAIRLTHVDGATVEGNTAPFSAPRKITAVALYSSTHVAVVNNTFSGAARLVTSGRAPAS